MTSKQDCDRNICDKCTFRIYWNDDYVTYNCSHKIHTDCLRVTKYSIINPTCSICNNGTFIKQKCIKQARILSKNEKLKKKFDIENEPFTNNNINDNDNNDININDNDININDNDTIAQIENYLQESENKNIIICQLVYKISLIFAIAFLTWQVISM